MASQDIADPESPESRRVENVERDFRSLTLYFLLIKITSGSNLEAADRSLKGGNSDPFVEVVANDQKYTSQTIMKSLNPVWNESTTFCFFDKMDEIAFKVYDFDKGTKCDAIGDCTLNTSQFYQDNHNGFSGDITLVNAKRGTINVSVTGRLIVPKELEDRCSNLEILEKTQANTIGTKENELFDLKSKNNELNSIKQIKQGDLEGSNVNFETLKMEEVSVKKECDAKRKQIDSVKKDIANVDSQVQELKDKKTALEEEKTDVEKKLHKTMSRQHVTLEKLESLRGSVLE